MSAQPPAPSFTSADLHQARERFRSRIDSLENDVSRCFWNIIQPGAPAPAPFPAVMYCFATLDYFSSLWAGWNQSAPKGQNQTDRMTAFSNRFLLYGRRESQIAIQFWRHKLMHTAEPRLVRDKQTGETFQWSMGTGPGNHMHLAPTSTRGSFLLHFNPVTFTRDLAEGIFGPAGYFVELRSDQNLQGNYQSCLREFEDYQITIKP